MKKTSKPDTDPLGDETVAPTAKKPNLTRRQTRELAERVAAAMGVLPVMQDARLESRQDRFERNLKENQDDTAELRDTNPEDPNP